MDPNFSFVNADCFVNERNFPLSVEKFKKKYLVELVNELRVLGPQVKATHKTTTRFESIS